MIGIFFVYVFFFSFFFLFLRLPYSLVFLRLSSLIHTIHLRSNTHCSIFSSCICIRVCLFVLLYHEDIQENKKKTCYILKTGTILFFCSGEGTYVRVYIDLKYINILEACAWFFSVFSFSPPFFLFFTFCFVCVSLLFVACFALSLSLAFLFT